MLCKFGLNAHCRSAIKIEWFYVLQTGVSIYRFGFFFKNPRHPVTGDWYFIALLNSLYRQHLVSISVVRWDWNAGPEYEYRSDFYFHK